MIGAPSYGPGSISNYQDYLNAVGQKDTPFWQNVYNTNKDNITKYGLAYSNLSPGAGGADTTSGAPTIPTIPTTGSPTATPPPPPRLIQGTYAPGTTNWNLGAMAGSPIAPMGGPVNQYGGSVGARPPTIPTIPSGSPIAPMGGAPTTPTAGGAAPAPPATTGSPITPMGSTNPWGGSVGAGRPQSGTSLPLSGLGTPTQNNNYLPSAGSSSPYGTLTGGSPSPGGGAPPDLASITNLVNSLNLQAQQAANAARVPGSQGLEQQSSNAIGSALGGQLPNDVVAQLSQQAAERGAGLGIAGSPNANASLLRSLGLTSLGLIGQGQNWLSAADARNPGAKIFDPTTQLMTPYQAGLLGVDQSRLGLDWYNALNRGLTGGAGSTRGGGSAGGGDASPVSGTYLDPRIAAQIFGTGVNPANPGASGAGTGTYNDYTSQNDMAYLMGDTNVNPYTGVADAGGGVNDPFTWYDSSGDYSGIV